MGKPVSPLKAECEAYVQAEIERVGASGVDVMAACKVFVGKGASRTRARVWVEAVLADAVAVATPEITERRRAAQAALAEVERLAKAKAQAAAKAAQATAKAEAKAVEVAAASEAKARAAAEAASMAEMAVLVEAMPDPVDAAEMAATVETVQRAIEGTPDISIVPDSARRLHEHMGQIIETHRKVMAVSLFPDGKMRNARQSIAASEALRRAVETMAKLYETLNNVAMIETFMRIMLAEVAKLAPPTAAAIVVQLRSIQQQWSAPTGKGP